MIKSFICLLFMGSLAQAANVATSDVTNQAQAKKWHILFDVNHQPPARDDQFAATDITLFFDYQQQSPSAKEQLTAARGYL